MDRQTSKVPYDPDVARTKRTRDLAFVGGASIALALSAPLARAAHGVPPVAVGAGRCAVAALAILVLAPRVTLRALGALSGKSRLALAMAGGLLAAHFALFLGGLARTSLAAAVALVSLEPVAVVGAAWLAFGVRPTRRESVGILIATLGAAAVARSAGEGENSIVGDLMVLGAVVLYGAYVMAARGLKEMLPVLPYAAGVFGVASVALAPFAIGALGDVAPPPVASIGWVIALGVVSTLIGHTLVQRSARHVAPSIVALVSPGETVGAIAIGAVAQGTLPTENEWLGVVLVLVGATLAMTGSPPKSIAIPPPSA
jgi:drug/metabolite transporter (DMT)-like permease